MEEIIRGLFQFEKEHTKQDTESVLAEIKEILETYDDRRPKDFGMLYKKIDEYLERSEFSKYHPNVYYNDIKEIIYIKFQKSHYKNQFEIELKYVCENQCQVIKFEQDDEDMWNEKECDLTFEEAYDLIRRLILFGCKKIWDL